ncbi:glutathione S-transferase HSP26 [Acrasis kona]|uniref:Glutathione S-transferase HSP26 n=1 Tax=Acrasis kona TaxID=1008807 RepID=A0AAW2Z6B1_9EUKA
MTNQITLYGYESSPFYQKVKNILAVKGLSHNLVEQAPMGARQDLISIGVKYRRIPVLVIGKDVYLDSALINEKISNRCSGNKIKDEDNIVALKSSELLVKNLFETIIGVADFSTLPEVFIKDRQELWPDFAKNTGQRPQHMTQLRGHLQYFEEHFKDNRAFLSGEEISIIDLSICFVLDFALNKIQYSALPGFGASEFPKVYEWIKRFSDHVDSCYKNIEVQKISGEDAKKNILGSTESFESVEHSDYDPLNLKVGDKVALLPTDQSNVYSQPGELVALNAKSVTVALDSGIRLHAPRIGFQIQKVE